ncbi:MAG: hypothetical protein B6I24_10055 [Bacteroidetes bacterium 4572_128]|nr:MAG: hypothetical protein B6I24_10055 [Bacteroidetes bacterium 4572_128]
MAFNSFSKYFRKKQNFLKLIFTCIKNKKFYHFLKIFINYKKALNICHFLKKTLKFSPYFLKKLII